MGIFSKLFKNKERKNDSAGIFSRLFKKKENYEYGYEMQTISQYTNPNDIMINYTKEGMLQIDFYDSNPRLATLNDSTRLVITNVSENLANKYIPKCLVSHYNSTDCQILKRGQGAISSRDMYQEVVADIDINLLQTDYQYCKTVMRDLLDSRRVNWYLEQGLEENPQKYCGKYIGGVGRGRNGYTKFFDAIAGQVSHYSPEMIQKRQMHREAEIEWRQKEIEENRKRNNQLYEEINELYK